MSNKDQLRAADEPDELEQSPSLGKLLLFNALKALSRSKLRGGDRLFALAERVGLLRGVLRYAIDENHAIYVPINRRWDLRHVLDYERELVSTIISKAQSMPGSIVLVDCGADIGLLSAMLSARIDRITSVVAFEPNEKIFPLLQKTLSELPCQTLVLRMGVSNLSGRGELRSPDYDRNGTAQYVLPVEHGGFPVTTIDDVLTERPAYCIIKIDVEGGELAVVEGAKACITDAKGVIVTIEAHPKVTARTGIDPTHILNLLTALRPFEFAVAELPRQRLELTCPFFEQADPEKIYNVVCSSAS